MRIRIIHLKKSIFSKLDENKKIMKTMKIRMKNTKNRKSKISYLTVQWLK